MKKNTPILALIILLIGLSAVFLLLSKSQKSHYNSININSQSKIYQSKLMKLAILVNPLDTVNEKFNSIVIKKEQGEIIIDTYGTNFETINEHVEDLSKKNNSVITDKQSSTINGYPSISAMIAGQKYFFIYPHDWTIYTFSTSSPDLFDDLDQIVHSFQYIP